MSVCCDVAISISIMYWRVALRRYLLGVRLVTEVVAQRETDYARAFRTPGPHLCHAVGAGGHSGLGERALQNSQERREIWGAPHVCRRACARCLLREAGFDA